jgi:hypothetical protein
MRTLVPSAAALFPLLLVTYNPLRQPQESSSQNFDPGEIQILMNPDIDIVYHTLAHFAIPGDPSNLYSTDYVNLIRQAKQDLEVPPTRLDHMRAELEKSYRQMPRLRFLNLAPFMADDYASFKQALLMIDYDFEKEKPEDSRETLESRRVQGKNVPLIFGNAKRLIPLFKKRFPEPAERQFVRQFAECMDDEQIQFYKQYREARSEVDQQNLERFMQFWKREGYGMIWPWAARSGVSKFDIFLSPVLRSNGRGIPVNQEQRVLFHVVAPLPETQDQIFGSVFVILHETTHRLTDRLVEEDPSSLATTNALRENLAFYADYRYVKTRYSRYQVDYLKFFLGSSAATQSNPGALESNFLKSYPLPASLINSAEDLVKGL